MVFFDFGWLKHIWSKERYTIQFHQFQRYYSETVTSTVLKPIFQYKDKLYNCLYPRFVNIQIFELIIISISTAYLMVSRRNIKKCIWTISYIAWCGWWQTRTKWYSYKHRFWVRCFWNKKILSSDHDWIFIQSELNDKTFQTRRPVRDKNYKDKFVFYIKDFVSFGTDCQPMFLFQIYSYKRILVASMCHNFNMITLATKLTLHIKLGKVVSRCALYVV